MPEPRHWFESHTGEVAIGLLADDAEGVFVALAAALGEVLASELDPEPRPPVHIALEAHDLPALLVSWADEIIFRAERHGVAPVAARVSLAHDGDQRARLAATLSERGITAPKTAIKAATLHGLSFEARADGVAARLVIDV